MRFTDRIFSQFISRIFCSVRHPTVHGRNKSFCISGIVISGILSINIQVVYNFKRSIYLSVECPGIAFIITGIVSDIYRIHQWSICVMICIHPLSVFILFFPFYRKKRRYALHSSEYTCCSGYPVFLTIKVYKTNVPIQFEAIIKFCIHA